MTGRWMILLAASVPLSAVGQDEGPDLALLEYLGSWDDSDEEWVVVADEFMGRQDPAAGLPAGPGETENETDDGDELAKNSDED